MGAIILLFLFLGIITIAGIILCVLSVIFFIKHKIALAIVLMLVGLLLITPVTLQFIGFLIFHDDFKKEYTQLSSGFSEIYKFKQESIVGMHINIQGNINGRGKLLINHPHKEEQNIQFELEGEINKYVNTRYVNSKDWDTPEFRIEFIPENEFVNGKLIINITKY